MAKNPFLIDIDLDKTLPDYELVLCRMNEIPIQELNNIEGFEIKKFFAGVDEISFSVPFYRTESNGYQVKNEIYDLVDGGMMVFVNKEKYFILTKPSIHTNEDTGEISKKILGLSREYELAQKRLVGYEAPSRMIYDRLDVVDGEGPTKGMQRGFMNYVEKTTSWKIDYVNEDLLKKFRHLTFSKTTYLQAFGELQKTFGCLFKFDTVLKTISIYTAEQLGVDKGLYISDRNFISSLKQDVNHDEIKTRLYLYGDQNVSIQSLNITGQPYIENLDFYRNTKYMSEELLAALTAYDNFVKTKAGQFNKWLADMKVLQEALVQFEIDFTALETQRKEIGNRQDVIISTGQPTKDVAKEFRGKKAEVEAKQSAIDAKKAEILALEKKLNDLGESLKMSSRIKDEKLVRELDPFIREDEYSDSNYNQDNLQELWDEGVKILGQISYPHLQFDVEVDDFLSMIGAQHIWDRFVLGDIVTLEHEVVGFNYKVKLIAYTHNHENNSLKLTFSNKDSIDDPNVYLKDLLEGISTTASTVDFNKYKWDKGETAELEISQYVGNNLDLAKQQLVKARGEMPIVDERGIWLTKKNADDSVNGAQMRLINNMLAITKDDWSTVEVAISAEKGVNANVVSGKLGQFAKLSANQIEVGGTNGRISFVDLGTPDGTTGDAYVTTLTKHTITTTDLIADKLQVRIANVLGTITADTVKTNWVYSGTVKANQLLMGGTDGTISFEDLSGKPNITKITNDTISTTTVNAVNLKVQSANIQGTITADGVKSNWVYAGNVRANQLVMGGANGRISFGELDNTGHLATTVGATAITKDMIQTGQLTAKNLTVMAANISGTITAGALVARMSISAPNIVGGTIEGSSIVSVGTHNTIELQNSSRTPVGAISYNSLRNEMWIRSENGHKMKIQSSGELSIGSGGGRIYLGTTQMSPDAKMYDSDGKEMGAGAATFG